MTTPSLAATLRRPVTLISRARRRMTAHAGDAPHGDHPDERRHHDELVGERVEELPEDADDAHPTREPAIDHVGERSDGEDNRCPEASLLGPLVEEPETERAP